MELGSRIGAPYCSGGCHIADLIRCPSERERNASKQKSDFGSLGSHVRMSLVEYDEIQFAARLCKDGSVNLADQHVFEHRSIGHEHGRRRSPQGSTIANTPRSLNPRRTSNRLRRLAVVKAVPEAAAEGCE